MTPDEIYVVLSTESEETIIAYLDSRDADKVSDRPDLYVEPYVPRSRLLAAEKRIQDLEDELYRTIRGQDPFGI